MADEQSKQTSVEKNILSTIKLMVEETQGIDDILSKDELNQLLDMGDTLTNLYGYSSKEMIDEVLISDEEYRSPHSKLLKLVEVSDDTYKRLLSTISNYNEKTTPGRNDQTLSNKAETLECVRTMKGLASELKSIKELIADKLSELKSELNEDNIKNIDWNKLKMDAMIANAHAILDQVEQSGQPLERVMQQLQNKDRAVIKKVMNSKTHVHKPPQGYKFNK